MDRIVYALSHHIFHKIIVILVLLIAINVHLIPVINVQVVIMFSMESVLLVFLIA